MSLEGSAPTDQTEVFVLRDDEYLYFGFRCYDSQPDKVYAIRTQRDIQKSCLAYAFDRKTIYSMWVTPEPCPSPTPQPRRSSMDVWMTRAGEARQ